MARALLVGCGCRGRTLGAALALRGWEVRGTSRSSGGLEAIAQAGLEAVEADPGRPGTVLDAVEGVALVVWLMGTATGSAESVDALHGSRLESLLERLVETPVRGFVYEGIGSAGQARLERGAGAVRSAGERWRIPVAVVGEDPQARDRWLQSMLGATERLIG